MSLDKTIKDQLKQYLELLKSNIIIKLSVSEDKNSKEVRDFVEEIAAMTDKISVVEETLEMTPSFSIEREDFESGIAFAGVPLGHEFTSFVLALLQVGGNPPKISEEEVKRIKSIKDKLAFKTYVSLSCHNCPDVVQALNIMSVLNPNISHTMVEGGMYQDIVEAKGIMAVPTVYLNDEEFLGGRSSLDAILTKLGVSVDTSVFENLDPFDVLVVGGGPAGASAAIYAARKGIRTGIVAKEFGGQVKETLGIENVIGTKYTEGPKLMDQVKEHVLEYNVDIFENQNVSTIKETEDGLVVVLESGAEIAAKTVIIATGAGWRNIGAPGEAEFKNKGVAYCPHCDGPLFKGKDLAVIGGGNSGIEAAIDLAGIVKNVTVLEFLPELKADKILQDRLFALPNVTVKTNVQTTEITGTDSVNGLTYIDRDSGDETKLEVQGVFVQIGLVPNTGFLKDILEMNPRGEIIVDDHGATSMPGVFAAGDCTNSAYKQIVISMGSGATAALGAFDYLIRKEN
ncbi:MAG: alkyl hydroperoxide reductase subunit F [Tissierellia bacterium]|nr:alkyl hydroperoxide reductase subunit F [Tissierellia bacterium]